MAGRSKYLANVLNVQLNTHTLVTADALRERTFIIYIEKRHWEEPARRDDNNNISLITEGYSILSKRSFFFTMHH